MFIGSASITLRDTTAEQNRNTSAVVSRKVMEADPMNIAHCPYSIFVTDIDGAVSVGYPTYPDGPMQEVQALLDEITQSALDGF